MTRPSAVRADTRLRSAKTRSALLGLPCFVSRIWTWGIKERLLLRQCLVQIQDHQTQRRVGCMFDRVEPLISRRLANLEQLIGGRLVAGIARAEALEAIGEDLRLRGARWSRDRQAKC